MINLEWIRTFKAIYEKGSMTAAAEVLFTSQPGVSLHLKSLENYIGYQLFERLPRKLVPTERGKMLYNAVIDPLSRLEEIERNVQRSGKTDVPSITLGMCFETFQLCLEPSVPELPFNLILEFGDYHELLGKLDNNVVDLVVTPRKEAITEIEYRAFSQEHILIVAGSATDIRGFNRVVKAQKKTDLLDWLIAKRWYGIAGDNEHLHRFWMQNFDRHPDFRPNYIVPNIQSILRCLASGDGLAVVPDFLALPYIERGEIKMLWAGSRPLTNTLYFARRKRSLHTEALDRIEEIISARMPARCRAGTVELANPSRRTPHRRTDPPGG
ncbi:LysR family transcriptional regulator [Pontiellaceae bacterium B12219]|nr:LysR family transcriptional regulator [Pontiellaceae bacterium B12219]